ncbi:MAG TPA: GYF domain-containing protein, partial [Puia sp.]|nr:GYF domain-containing protein [Puia sp.]
MYLLLRDNKQTGPYTLDELKAKGMKAYDLVWVEGRSAAWRYPSEIDELRAFAPAVEEQPFDRFFKKPVTSPSTPAPAVAGEPLVSSAATVKRTIYVTMPGGVPKQITREIPMREATPAREAAPLREAPS